MVWSWPLTRMVLDTDGIGRGWWLDVDGGWTRMVVGHGWWLNVDGYQLNVDGGWWLDADGGWTQMSRKKNEKSEKTYSWSC